MLLKSINKEVTLVERTRLISRQINEELLKDVIVVDWEATRIPAINANRSEELTVKLLFSLSDSEIDNITDEEYELLKKEINKKK